jgi:hypothetical protein
MIFTIPPESETGLCVKTNHNEQLQLQSAFIVIRKKISAERGGKKVNEAKLKYY